MKLSFYVCFWLLATMISVKYYTYVHSKILAGGFQSTDYISIVIVPFIFISATGLLVYRILIGRSLY